MSITPASFSTTSWFVSLILEGGTVPLPLCGAIPRRNRQSLWLDRVCFLGSCASMDFWHSRPQCSAACPSNDLKNVHLKGPVPLPQELKLKVDTCLFLKMLSIATFIGASLWHLCQNVLPNAGPKLVSSLVWLLGGQMGFWVQLCWWGRRMVAVQQQQHSHFLPPEIDLMPYGLKVMVKRVQPRNLC